MRQLVGVVGLQTSHVILCDFERTDMGAKSTSTTGRLASNQSHSPSFHRFLVAYRMICSRTMRIFYRRTLLLLEILRINMLSELEKDVALRKESFWGWLLETLPDIEREVSSHDTPLRPYDEVRARLTTAIIKGERRDKKHDFETDGHVELGDNLLLVVEAKSELGEESSDPHWHAMAYVRAYYMQKRCNYRVGQSPLPAVLIAFYGMFIPLASMPTC